MRAMGLRWEVTSTTSPDWARASHSERWVLRSRYRYLNCDYICHAWLRRCDYIRSDAVLASQGRDHWTGEWLDWELIGTYDNRDAATGKGENKKRYAMLPTIDHRTNQPEPDFVICAWCTNDAKHDMTPQELLQFCTAVLNHSPNWGGSIG
jgi:hypothetical protein